MEEQDLALVLDYLRALEPEEAATARSILAAAGIQAVETAYTRRQQRRNTTRPERREPKWFGNENGQNVRKTEFKPRRPVRIPENLEEVLQIEVQVGRNRRTATATVVGPPAESVAGLSMEEVTGLSTEQLAGLSAEPSADSSTEPVAGMLNEPAADRLTESEAGGSTEAVAGSSNDPVAGSSWQPIAGSSSAPVAVPSLQSVTQAEPAGVSAGESAAETERVSAAESAGDSAADLTGESSDSITKPACKPMTASIVESEREAAAEQVFEPVGPLPDPISG